MINIALVQFQTKLNQSVKILKKRVEKFIKKAKEKNCQIICFPEDFCFGSLDYYTNEQINDISTIKTNTIIKSLCSFAKKYQINVIGGTFIKKIENSFVNTGLVINNEGQIIYSYNKQKLVSFGFESKKITPGKNYPKIFKLSNIKCGLIICRELFYPELFKVLKEQKVEIIFIPAFWSKRSNDYDNHRLINKFKINTEARVVDLLCRSRAIENMTAICFINACGKLKKGNTYDVLLGRTQVCLPFYGCFKKLNKNKEDMLIFNFDVNLIADAKKAYKL